MEDTRTGRRGGHLLNIFVYGWRTRGGWYLLHTIKKEIQEEEEEEGVCWVPLRMKELQKEEEEEEDVEDTAVIAWYSCWRKEIEEEDQRVGPKEACDWFRMFVMNEILLVDNNLD